MSVSNGVTVTAHMTPRVHYIGMAVEQKIHSQDDGAFVSILPILPVREINDHFQDFRMSTRAFDNMLHLVPAPH